MREDRLFPEGTIPEWTKPEWYEGREWAPHVDQAMHRPRIDLAVDMLLTEVHTYDTIVDLGAGDGGLLSLLRERWLERDEGPLYVWGYDLQPSNVAAAKDRGIQVELVNVLTDRINWGRVAVATEVLEHLVDPHDFVRTIGDHSEVLVASSPWTESLGNAYGFHTWAWDVEGYARMLTEGGWRIVTHRTTGMFQVALAVRS